MSAMLADLEKRLAAKRLSMVFAAESGSRAWGFNSPDSDYDIRFIFAKRVECYLSLHDGLQDIQYKADGDLDYAGWDLRKALLLAEKSNPSLLEWLGSPIQYADPIGFCDELRAIMAEHYSPRALAHHYINFMRNIRGKYLSDFIGEYTMKRYFYALRPILCIMYMQMYPKRLPPVVFQDMLVNMTLPHELAREIQKLLVLKLKAKEKEDYNSPILDEFIKDWFDKGHDIVNEFSARSVPTDLLNDLFRKTILKLDAGWSSPVARQAHNLKVASSNLAPASKSGADLEEAARVFATNAHTAIGQTRKYTGEPYINHPAAVVEIVRSRPHTEVMLAAAWLHDVVEDAGVSLKEIREVFGDEVARLVYELTDASTPHDGNRETRKLIDREHTAKASPAAKTIKLADLIDNTRSIVARDPDFAKVYLHEKRRLLEVLKEGDHQLWLVASDLAALEAA